MKLPLWNAKREIKSMRVAVGSVTLLFLCLFVYCLTQQPKVSITPEYAKLMLIRGGYRSWTIYWSDGLQLNPDGTTTNLWRWPTFAHTDIRRLNIRTEKAR